MKGICIGVGNGWREAAHKTAGRMEQMTGIECIVIDQCPDSICHPSWIKAWLLDMFPQEDSFLSFDADLLPIKPWRPQQLFEDLGRPFCGVPDRNCNAVREECKKFNLAYPDWYINGGLLIFGREHAAVWEYVRLKHPRYGSWLEQTAINEALFKLGTEVARLPRKFNRFYTGSSFVSRANAINLHFAGFHNPLAVAEAVDRIQHQPHELPCQIPPRQNPPGSSGRIAEESCLR